LPAHFGKFRVTSLIPTSVGLDWAYQTAPDNGELRLAPSRDSGPRVRPTSTEGQVAAKPL